MSAFSVTGEIVTAAFLDIGVGVQISIPLDTMTWADKTLVVHAGASIRVPEDTLTLVTNFRVTSGKRISTPQDIITWVDLSPRVTGGIRVLVPKDSISWTDKSLRVTTGYRISIVNTVYSNFDIGVTGDSVTSEFRTLEGPEFQILTSYPDRLILSSTPVKALSGTAIRVPKTTLGIIESPVDIQARLRRIKTAAITS